MKPPSLGGNNREVLPPLECRLLQHTAHSQSSETHAGVSLRLLSGKLSEFVRLHVARVGRNSTKTRLDARFP